MTTTTAPALATQVYSIFIRTTPEKLWEAITTPQFTQQYFYGARIDRRPRPLRVARPRRVVWGDDEVFEFDPPRRMVHAWKSRYSPEVAEEPASRVTWEIEPRDGGTACSR